LSKKYRDNLAVTDDTVQSIYNNFVRARLLFDIGFYKFWISTQFFCFEQLPQESQTPATSQSQKSNTTIVASLKAIINQRYLFKN
jgi:hypothetical protein